MSQNFATRIPWIDGSEQYGPNIIKKFLHQVSPYKTVLDIGCGSGRDLDMARSICPQAVPIALECNPHHIATLAERGILCHQCNIEKDNFPLENETIDVIIANQVFEHTKEIFWLMHEVMRTLRVGGHVLLGVPNVASLHNRISLLFGRHPSQAKLCSAHVRVFSKHDTLYFFDTVFPQGITLTAFAGSQFYPFPRETARFLANIFPNSAFSIFFLLKKTRSYTGEFCQYLVDVHLETNFWQGSPRATALDCV